jgi:hypothetical protein
MVQGFFDVGATAGRRGVIAWGFRAVRGCFVGSTPFGGRYLEPHAVERGGWAVEMNTERSNCAGYVENRTSLLPLGQGNS